MPVVINADIADNPGFVPDLLPYNDVYSPEKRPTTNMRNRRQADLTKKKNKIGKQKEKWRKSSHSETASNTTDNSVKLIRN